MNVELVRIARQATGDARAAVQRSDEVRVAAQGEVRELRTAVRALIQAVEALAEEVGNRG
jgi:hypothetical protein